MKWRSPIMPPSAGKNSFLMLAWAVLAGCGGGNPLDYETAMDLLRDHSSEPVKTTFSASPRHESNDRSFEDAYGALTEGHVLDCSQAAGGLCVPGPAGDLLKQEGATGLSMIAGRWVPDVILSIQRGGRISASAEVRMKFEPTLLYREFESALNVIQYPADALAMSATKQGKIMHATFQRYDDRWQLETLE